MDVSLNIVNEECGMLSEGNSLEIEIKSEYSGEDIDHGKMSVDRIKTENEEEEEDPELRYNMMEGDQIIKEEQEYIMAVNEFEGISSRWPETGPDSTPNKPRSKVGRKRSTNAESQKRRAKTINIEELIVQVRKHPHLYDISHAKYNDSAAIQESWHEISRETGCNEKVCKKQWSFLRGNYRKSIMKTSRKYKYLKAMEFLRPFMTNEDVTESTPPLIKREISSTTTGHVTKKCIEPDKLLHTPVDRLTLFFHHLEGRVRAFPESLQIKIKSEISNIIDKAELETYKMLPMNLKPSPNPTAQLDTSCPPPQTNSFSHPIQNPTFHPTSQPTLTNLALSSFLPAHSLAPQSEQNSNINASTLPFASGGEVSSNQSLFFSPH